MKTKLRLTESELISLIEKVVIEEAFDLPKSKMEEEKFIEKIKNKLEDAYMVRDWVYIREVIRDLKQKLKN